MTKDRSMADTLARFWRKVDKSGECWEWMAARNQKGYGAFSLRGKMIGSHRIAYEIANGPVPAGMEVDHRCHNRGCVNPDHLRATTTKQNQENRGAIWAPSGIRGVHRDKSGKKWNAHVKHNGRLYNAGLFTDISDAAAAVVALRNKLFTHNDADRKPREQLVNLFPQLTEQDTV